MYFDLLALVDASVSNLTITKMTNEAITIEAVIKYDFNEYIARLDTNHLNYNVVIRDKDLGIISIIITK